MDGSKRTVSFNQNEVINYIDNNNNNINNKSSEEVLVRKPLNSKDLKYAIREL